jgi:hypothetical protein
MERIFRNSLGFLACLIFSWIAANTAYICYVSAEEVTLKSLIGEYRGNVNHSFLGLGMLAKTGRLKVELDGHDNIRISSWSARVNKLEVSIARDKLEPFFGSKKKEIFELDNGRIEERVAFIHSVDDDYSFLNRWLGGLTATRYAYQLKFIDGILNAFRIQRYNTSSPKKLDYLLEVSYVEKIAAAENQDEQEHDEQEDNVPDAKKTDWNF